MNQETIAVISAFGGLVIGILSALAALRNTSIARQNALVETAQFLQTEVRRLNEEVDKLHKEVDRLTKLLERRERRDKERIP